ncbi:MAG TPA: hypothetical protein VEY30_04710 [Myxococcaceae bacterium]|nr:hypothetical protein [Myxococcaceae bacterium]
MLAPFLLTAAVLAQGPSLTFPGGQAATVNIIQWDANQLPKVYERSAQLPLTDEEVAKLSKAGFDGAQLVKMIEERHCACDASAEGLIKLKGQGVPKEVISAVSLHGLRPNRSLLLDVILDFTGIGSEARENFLYFFIDDGDVTRVFTASLSELLSRPRAHETTVDRSDILIARQVRRIRLAGDVPLKRYGKHNVLVAASAKPTLTHPSQLTEQERARAQSYTLEYPRVSLQNVCRLNAGYKRDPVLAYKWAFMGSRFECEWD